MPKADTPIAQDVLLDRLTPAPWNPRTIRDERFKNLCRSIETDPEFMRLRPVLATTDGTIYAGNMRYRAAQHLGWKSVPAILADIPEQLAKERALRDNAQWGEWQDDELAQMLYELSESGSDVDLLGFDEKALKKIMDEVAGGDVPGDAPLDEQWMVLVECKDEAQQAELLGRFEAEGLTCRALIS